MVVSSEDGLYGFLGDHPSAGFPGWGILMMLLCKIGLAGLPQIVRVLAFLLFADCC